VTAAATPDMTAWCAVVERLRSERAPLASIFDHAIPAEVGATRVVIGFDPTASFVAARANEPEALEALTRAARAHFGAPTDVVLARSVTPIAGVRTVAAMEAERRAGLTAKARAAVQDHPVVKEAIRLFGAQVRDVKLPAGEG
jgi:hypothetical protein